MESIERENDTVVAESKWKEKLLREISTSGFQVNRNIHNLNMQVSQFLNSLCELDIHLNPADLSTVGGREVFIQDARIFVLAHIKFNENLKKLMDDIEQNLKDFNFKLTKYCD